MAPTQLCRFPARTKRSVTPSSETVGERRLESNPHLAGGPHVLLLVAAVVKQGYRAVQVCTCGHLCPVPKLSVAERFLGCEFLFWGLRYISSSFFALPEKQKQCFGSVECSPG